MNFLQMIIVFRVNLHCCDDQFGEPKEKLFELLSVLRSNFEIKLICEAPGIIFLEFEDNSKTMLGAVCSAVLTDFKLYRIDQILLMGEQVDLKTEDCNQFCNVLEEVITRYG
jgi:hypothetical protein